MTTLESTIDTLSNQLGSLVDSGEVFEKNAQKREENLMQQISRLRKGRKKDRDVYKTAVDASNAWRIRAENAESLLADHATMERRSDRKKVSLQSSSNRPTPRSAIMKRKDIRPTPPTSNEHHSDANGVSSTKRRNRKYVSSNSLPPVSSAAPLKAAPA